MTSIPELLTLLGISEVDAIKAILSAAAPPSPPTVRQNWTRSSYFGNTAPAASVLWKKLEDADFRCPRCGSQMRLSFNHVNSDSKDHSDENIEVLCFSCNRAASKKGTVDFDQYFRLTMAAIDLWKERKLFPELRVVCAKAGVRRVGGASYLLKYLRKRLEERRSATAKRQPLP